MATRADRRTGSASTKRVSVKRHRIILAALAILAGLAGALWLGIATAGTAEPHDSCAADPAVIAMGVPCRSDL